MKPIDNPKTLVIFVRNKEISMTDYDEVREMFFEVLKLRFNKKHSSLVSWVLLHIINRVSHRVVSRNYYLNKKKYNFRTLMNMQNEHYVRIWEDYFSKGFVLSKLDFVSTILEDLFPCFSYVSGLVFNLKQKLKNVFRKKPAKVKKKKIVVELLPAPDKKKLVKYGK